MQLFYKPINKKTELLIQEIVVWKNQYEFKISILKSYVLGFFFSFKENSCM